MCAAISFDSINCVQSHHVLRQKKPDDVPDRTVGEDRLLQVGRSRVAWPDTYLFPFFRENR